MPLKRRKFERPLGQLRYKKIVFIAAEGQKTEPSYFNQFNRQGSLVRVSCLKNSHGSPSNVLKNMKDYLRNESLRADDEAWLVVDRDSWTDEQLRCLHEWSQKRDNYHLALSNPRFEYWLLLHFENGNRVTTPQECSNRLRKYLPEYDKSIDPKKTTSERINSAIQRAKQRDNPPCTDWPRTFGSTVYRLVENILKTSNTA